MTKDEIVSLIEKDFSTKKVADYLTDMPTDVKTLFSYLDNKFEHKSIIVGMPVKFDNPRVRDFFHLTHRAINGRQYGDNDIDHKGIFIKKYGQKTYDAILKVLDNNRIYLKNGGFISIDTSKFGVGKIERIVFSFPQIYGGIEANVDLYLALKEKYVNQLDEWELNFISEVENIIGGNKEVEKEDTKIECPNCSGTGEIKLYQHIEGGKCFTCGGSGYVYKHKIEESAERKKKRVEKKEKELELSAIKDEELSVERRKIAEEFNKKIIDLRVSKASTTDFTKRDEFDTVGKILAITKGNSAESFMETLKDYTGFLSLIGGNHSSSELAYSFEKYMREKYNFNYLIASDDLFQFSNLSEEEQDIFDAYRKKFESIGQKENKEMAQKGNVTNDELDKAVSDLHRAETLQETMKKANAIIRSKKNVTERLISEAGMSESSAIKAQQPDYAGRVGFATYQLTNNNASIKRLQERVKMLEKKVEGAKAAEAGAEEKYTFDGGVIKVNYEEDRVQILLDSVRADKPMYQMFRKNGYVFSPTNKAFQRKITPQAIRNAVQLMKATKVSGSSSKIEEVELVSSLTYEKKLEDKEFSYVSGNLYNAMPKEYTGAKTFNLVYFDLSINNITEGVKLFFKKEFPEMDVEKLGINIYPKTYIRESKKLCENRAYLPSNRSSVEVLGSGMVSQIKNFFKFQKDSDRFEEPKSLMYHNLEYNHPLNILDPKSTQYKEALEEERKNIAAEKIIEPNTGDEFDEVIMANIDPKDQWKGHLMKERDVKLQIYSQLSGAEDEKEKEVERLFQLYASKVEGDVHEKHRGLKEAAEKMNAEFDAENKGKYYTDEKGEVVRSEINELKGFMESETKKNEYDFNNIIKREDVSIKEVSPETVFKGILWNYKNQYELNKAIEAFITEREKGEGSRDYYSDEKNFIRKYSGYGGLDKYGTTGKGGLFEYYTPKEIIERMWALAYKYGYNNGSVLEPSIGIGEFLQYAPKDSRIVGYEINEFSAKICKILYPTAEVNVQPFEKTFIGKNNWTMKDSLGTLEKFDLVIGNPPYGDFSIVESRYMSGMGEKDHTKARNYVEYFIRRGLDLLKSGGLLIYIVGAQLKNGGNMFLDSGETPVKDYLAANCELLDAYRLPDSVFERTGVTSDILILKKR